MNMHHNASSLQCLGLLADTDNACTKVLICLVSRLGIEVSIVFHQQAVRYDERANDAIWVEIVG
jgi:hypothetical protein